MRYDVIVCGGGSAGSVLASRLAEDPDCAVLLLEAGPDYPDPAGRPEELSYARVSGPDIMRSPHNWRFLAAGAGGREVVVGGGKVVGGSSAISGPTLLRGAREDFDSWAARGNDQWAYADVLDAFRMLETDEDFDDAFHGRRGPVPVKRFERSQWLPAQAAFVEACLGLGHSHSPDLNHPDAAGVGPTPMSTLDERRWNVCTGYLDHARRGANLTVKAGATVRRVLLAGGQATGVEFAEARGVGVAHADEIVVACGAVRSPQLLMLSGIGPPERVRQLGVRPVVDLSGVGANLTDHAVVSALYRTEPGVELDPSRPLRQVALQYTSSQSPDRNDMKINIQSCAWDGTGPDPVGVELRVGLFHPRSVGSVEVMSADPEVPPRVRLGHLQEPWDRARLREGLRLADELARQPALRDVIADRRWPGDAALKDDASLDRWVANHLATAHHLAGTCAMGKVVDQYGRLHGVPNLRVADASVMPTSIRANTHLSTIMLAERVAAFMRGRTCTKPD